MMRRPATPQPMLEHSAIRRLRHVHLFIAAAFVLPAAPMSAQAPAALKHFISEDSPVLVLNHARVIDATGATRHRLLEIHFIDAARAFGGFFEKLLTIGPA
jgi:hypothetical protein